MKCLTCGGDEVSLLTSRLRRGSGDVFLCEECDLGMLKVEGERGQKYYSEQYRKQYVPELGHETNPRELFETYARYQGMRLELIREKLRPEMRLLEIGCSAGQFLYAVKPFVSEIVGIDYDEKAAAHASRVCECRTYSSDLDKTECREGYFDIICMFQVLEHVEEPLELLSTARRYLRAGGLLYVEVPNLHDPLISLYENRGYWEFYFHDAHLFYFSPRSLKKLLTMAGFEGEIHFVQDYNVLNHMHWIYTNGPQSHCHEGLSAPKLPLSPKLDEKRRDALQLWIRRVDEEYSALLKELQLTENISFIGTCAPRAGDR